MSFSLISTAAAATGTAAPAASANAGNMPSIILLVVFIAVFYFLLIRPQSKRAKEHQNLVNNLQRGDEVVTSGGIFGKIVNIEDNIITLALNGDTEIKLQKAAIGSVLPKGTLKF